MRWISAAVLIGFAGCTEAGLAAAPATAPSVAFVEDGKGYRFDTGALRGILRRDGKSLGVTPLFEASSGLNLAGPYGIFSHYRLLDAEHRYGTAGWDWKSTSSLLPDGAVQVNWTADSDHPFDLAARYRWKKPNVLDLTTTVTARQDLKRFEVFLASYLPPFDQSLVYSKDGYGLKPALRTNGDWQMFPRDAQAERTIGDGRWKRPPNPVDWKILPALAAPLAIRRDAKSGLAAVIMARPQDCFAIATPYGEEAHRSLYLCLFGRDLTNGETATAPTRLIIGKDINDSRAIELYEEFRREEPQTNTDEH